MPKRRKPGLNTKWKEMRPQDLASLLLEEWPDVFLSAVLTPESQRLLLERVPPVHQKVYAHHVTMAFKPDPATLDRYRPLIGQKLRIPVTAVAVDDKAQAVVVGADSENEVAHITISVAEGVEPSYSNTLLASADLQHISIFTVEAEVVLEHLDDMPPTHR